MMAKLILVRHAEVQIEKEIDPTLWKLSPEGRESIHQLSKANVWRDIQKIYTSPETKAIETAQILAAHHRLDVETIEDLREVDRSHGGFLPHYEEAAKEFFTKEGENIFGWERAIDAEGRIVRGIERLVRANRESSIAVVSHGLVLTLYVTFITSRRGERLNVWKKIGFPAYMVLNRQTGNVIKDWMKTE